MNQTLQKFAYPTNLIAEYAHWVVLVRPQQVTYGSAVIAAKSSGASLGELTAAEASELPSIIGDYEKTISQLAQAEKFNYLALMMIDPNPHFHALPRYSKPIIRDGCSFFDATFPKPPDLNVLNEVNASQLQLIRRRLATNWRSNSCICFI
ncbi:hypothetical protein [Azonexus sp.]|jgi:diadenosine tetraphosphate (Ap4A) HIT family hydrolase|uniref:hypothetical protein n=1 Tax=Azonexus sp. TaxID=1872668 RepID=UPI0028293669|nr:hypothetical protein [Azonexus sp.]MDR1995202.1 hypothetical protein [Azonexus sp.]